MPESGAEEAAVPACFLVRRKFRATPYRNVGPGLPGRAARSGKQQAAAPERMHKTRQEIPRQDNDTPDVLLL